MSKWKFQWYKPRTVAFTKCRLRDEPKGRCWSGMPPSESMQVSALPPVWIDMIISCWSVKLLKLPSVTLTHVCGTNSRNWWAKGLVGVGVVKIFCDSDSDSSGWKFFRLRLHSPVTDTILNRAFVFLVCQRQCTMLHKWRPLLKLRHYTTYSTVFTNLTIQLQKQNSFRHCPVLFLFRPI